MQELLEDATATAYVAVALPEEMPVNETLELEDALPDIVGRGLSEAQAMSGTSADGQGSARAALGAARVEERRARGQQSQLQRLRRGADAPVVTLPFLFTSELRLDDLEILGRELERKLPDG